MSKIAIISGILTGSLVAFADLPIHLIFGMVFVGILIEIKKIQKQFYPIISNWLLSSFVGWGAGKGLLSYKPELMSGDMRIFSIMIITFFAYLTVIYFFKNETIEKAISQLIERLISKISPKNNKNENDSIN